MIIVASHEETVNAAEGGFASHEEDIEMRSIVE